jgi:hypothetical protein
VVTLSNQFQTRRVELIRTEQFCNAVDKNGEGILDPSAHLTCYKVGRPVSAVRPRVIATDQFGELELNVRKRRTQLCVPSQEIGTPVNRSIPEVPSLDHFELYSAATTPGESKFERREVSLEDPFLDETVELKKPVRLGVPTSKNNEGIDDPDTHLTCYSLKAPSFDKRDVEVSNQFGEFRLTVKKPNMLCVPSSKQVVDDD